MCSKVMNVLVVVVGILSLTFVANQARADLSGDAALDASIPPTYKIRAGGHGSGVNRGTNNAKCNSGTPSVEKKCPNDATFTPAANTGGYQAWAVGLRPFYEEHNEVECDWIIYAYWIDGTLVINPVWHCYLASEDVLSGYFGIATVKLKWGSTVKGTGSYSSLPTSILAFHPSSLTPCSPVVGVSDARCSNPKDSSYIGSLGGYEADITFPDPGCAQALGTVIRGGNNLADGCFDYFSGTQISTLPNWYKDTTYLDPADTFNIGFGSADAEAIQPGVTYVARQFFGNNSAPIMTGLPAKHKGQATVKASGHPACVIGSGDAFCYFAIDTAEVGVAADAFQQVIP